MENSVKYNKFALKSIKMFLLAGGSSLGDGGAGGGADGALGLHAAGWAGASAHRRDGRVVSAGSWNSCSCPFCLPRFSFFV